MHHLFCPSHTGETRTYQGELGRPPVVQDQLSDWSTGIGLSARSTHPLTAEARRSARERDPTRARQPPACTSGLRVVTAGVAHLLGGCSGSSTTAPPCLQPAPTEAPAVISPTELEIMTRPQPCFAKWSSGSRAEWECDRPSGTLCSGKSHASSHPRG